MTTRAGPAGSAGVLAPPSGGGDGPRTMYGWFAAAAASGTDRIALEVGGEEVTYGELADLAGRIAALLIRRCGTVPSRIGLLAGRTLAAYAGYLAVQRLGATAVPLNPAAPAARNTTIARLAGVDAVLADRDAAGGPDLPVPVVRLSGRDVRALPAAGLPDVRAGARDIAYILFTSGSTGAPKGVCVEHRNVNAYLEHVVPRYAAGPGARFSQFFDLTFDPSVYDMFTAWGSGSTLVVPARQDLLSPVRFVNASEVTHWTSVPSAISFALRMGELGPSSMPGLRWSLFCGEPLTLRQAEARQAAAPRSVLENVYGPTEMTVTCAGHRLPRDRRDWVRPSNGTVPIGTVHPGLEQLVVDERGRPAAEGELCLRGPQRFPGYLDPADDEGRFVAFDGERVSAYDGSAPLTDDHWYRTGDRVGRLPGAGGGLVHLGRVDHQVKVSGYRVEPGEIEAVLREHPAVTDAVALAVDAGDGEAELVAAYTGAQEAEGELLAALHARLPAYMVPRALTAFAAFPLTGNGKTDRKAVGAACSARLRAPAPHSLLAEVRGLLGNADLTPDDDLLDGGMTSLDAIRLATVLSARGRGRVTVSDVYRKRRLSAFTDTGCAVPAPAAPAAGDDGDRPLAHAQKRFLFAEAYAPGSADNLVVVAYELTGPLAPDVLRAALDDVVARHEALHTVYVWEEGRPVQRPLTGRAVPWEQVPAPAGPAPVRELAERITADLWDTPFRLDRELPLRARLCRLTPDRALLCLQFHHIAFDGASERILLDDLRDAYAARRDGGVPRFPPVPGQRLLGLWESRDVASQAADDVRHWRGVLAGCPPPCLPPARDAASQAPAHEAVRRLDAALVRRIGAAAARHGGPPLAVLAAGAARALARRSGVDDVCVGTLTTGRFDPAVDRVVGYLVNPFAVPLRGLRGRPEAVLAAAARQVVDALEHSRTPFDELVRELRAGHGGHGWFDAWVVLQHPPPAVSLGPVGLRPVRIRAPRTSRSWMAEAFPGADGGWDLVTTWRTDVLSPAAGTVLADEVAAAVAELAGV
ncbi:AMP-binding protein [Streptomyces sp. NPDC052309]|uniref:AMP-binding protein n=1 Tax=Streptomyces sp. NPDC052309 TaxID=3155421 RepID=UPI003431E9FA